MLKGHSDIFRNRTCLSKLENKAENIFPLGTAGAWKCGDHSEPCTAGREHVKSRA